MKLWQKYLFLKLLKLFLFIILTLFFMYLLVDLSIHGVKIFSSATSSWIEVLLYYLRIFAMHLELFFSLSFLLASLKVLIDLSTHQELVALQMAALSRKKLLVPFFTLAALLSLGCYINSQFLSLEAQDAAYAFKTTHVKTKKKEKRENVHSIALEDDTELVYQSFDAEAKELFDVFWVKSAKDVWYMKYLSVTPPLKGRFVDHLIRTPSGQFEKQESFLTHPFPEIPWDPDARLEKFIPFEHRALSTLIAQALSLSAEKQSVLSHLHYKIVMPLLPLLILISIAPIVMRFSRMHPTFLIVSCSLFAFIGFITLMDAMLILGENQVLPSHFAIWGPFLLFSSFSLHFFSRMR